MMDLLRGNPKAKPHHDWGTIARYGMTERKSVKTTPVGARGHPLSPPQIRRHLIPNYQLRPLPRKDAYKTLFSIPEGQAPPSVEVGVMLGNIPDSTFRRSNTLPPSRRTPVTDQLKVSKDDSSITKPFIKTFKNRLGSFRRQNKERADKPIYGCSFSSNTEIYVSKKLCSLKPIETRVQYDSGSNQKLFISENTDKLNEVPTEPKISTPEDARDSAFYPDSSDMESIATGKRNSYASSVSEFSRSNFTTSTDEGISSYDDTCSSSIWSSSEVPSEWKNDELSIYGEASLSSASTCSSGSSLFKPSGAIPKRWSSLRRPKGYYSDAQELRRGGSLRVPRQLPVTTTLLKLLQLGLEQVGTCSASVSGDSGICNGAVQRRDRLHPPRTDANRLSRANLEESGDLELDAILNELCALEGQLSLEISTKNQATPNTSVATGGAKMQTTKPTHVRTSSGTVKNKFDGCNPESETSNASLGRTDSPDNDSAFSDNVSMLSSESSASSGASGGGGVNSRHDSRQKAVDHDTVKAEKIKLALEKLKEANVRKLFIKAFSSDGSSKSLLVDEKMTVAHVTRLLVDKNHVRLDPKWAIVEHLPDLYMERIYEDNEMLVDNLLLWTRDSKNKLLFLERAEKFDFFLRPEIYVPSYSVGREIDDEARTNLIDECFTNCQIPEIEGGLFLKSEGKKAWKKFYFVLRQSGLYYCPKGKNSKSSKDLVCLAKLDTNQVYQGFNWKKKYKAPTDYCFALKHPHLQTKNSKLIRYLCAEDSKTLSQWVMGIRIAKCGQKLAQDYQLIIEDIDQEDIDMLASSRSFSLASVSAGSRGTSQATTPSSESRSLDSCLAPSVADDDESSTESSQDTPVNTLSRAPAWRQEICSSSSSSSGCLSERSSATPTGDHGFESDFPQGTIKRKPTGNPKIPLTSTTRHLVKEVDDSDSRSSTLRRPRKSLSEEVSTLRRRNSNNTSKCSLVSSVPSLPTEEFPPPPDVCEQPTLDIENLPCPPPELLASTLSLNSLPPPPEEAYMPVFPDEMTASIISLPPPPPPPPFPKPFPVLASPTTSLTPPATPPKPKSLMGSPPLPPPPQIAPKPKWDSVDGIYGRRSGSLPHPPLPFVAASHNIYENRYPSPTSPPQGTYMEGIYAGRQIVSPVPSSPTNAPNPIYEERALQPCLVNNASSVCTPKSPQKKKRITFMDDVQNIPPVSPSSPAKPLPPKRSGATRLSTPGRLDTPGCKVTPPRAFLTNLQKVMQKKWQVAEKCRDFDKMPHEVLGFRDPITQSEAEKNVGAWIEEHYGSLYENMSPNGLPPSSDVSQDNSIKKKPPPPLPKRSENTQLSVKN